MSKKYSQRKIRTIWNSVQRVNHKNQFVPTAVLTRTSKIPVNTARASGTNNVSTARHNFNRQAVPTNATMKVNTVKPIVNNARPKGDFSKSVSPFRKSLNRTTTLRTKFSYQKVNTAEVNAVSAVGGKRETAVKPSAGHFARECRTKGNQDSKRRDAWNSGNKDGRRSSKQEDSKALVTIDGEGVDWTSHSEEEEDYALMACNSSGSNTEVISYSKECKESYAELKKLYDKQRAQLSDASIEILSYTQALKKVEAQIAQFVAHQPRTTLVHTAEVNAVRAVGKKGKLLLNPQQNKGVLKVDVSTAQDWKTSLPAENQDFKWWPLVAYKVVKMCDKKNKVLFTDTGCLVLSLEFKLPDENQVLLRIPRQNNMYNFNLENIVPSGGLAYLIAKATINESNKWHRRLGHVNFKNLNKLMKGNLVRGLPSKIFQNDHTCVACQKGKQHKASCKAKSVNSLLSDPYNKLLQYDLFGPTSIRSFKTIKTYCQVHKKLIQNAGTKDIIDAGDSEKEAESAQDYFVLLIRSSYTSTVKSSKAVQKAPLGIKFPLTLPLLYKRICVFYTYQASIRSDLLFDDADGIDSLPNQAIFDAIQLIGYEGDLTVLTFNKAMFSNMLVQQTEDEGEQSERPSEPQPQSNPSPRPSPTTYIPDFIPESSSGNHGGRSSSDKSLSGNEGDMTLQSMYDLCISLCTQVTDQAKEIKHLKAQIKKLKKKAKPVISHHRAWMKSGRKYAKAEPLVHKDPAFDELDDDEIDNMNTEDAQGMGRTGYVVHEEKERKEKEVSTEDVVSNDKKKVSTDRSKVSTNRSKVSTDISKDSTDKEKDSTVDQMKTYPNEITERNEVYEEKESAEDVVSTEGVVSTDKEKVSTDRSKISTDRSKDSIDKEKDSTDRPDEGTVDQTEGRSATPTPLTPTPTIFGDDETIAQVLIIMSQNKEKLKEKEKGVELKDVEETERPRPTSTRSLLTLKPLPKIDPKDKGKKKIEEEDESDTESEGIPEAEKKFKQLARDEEMARKVQEDWEAEEEVKKLAEEEAIKAALSNEYDFIQARIEADRLLALRLQDEERESKQRAIAIRNRPPTRTQLRNQMMTYLKHVGNKKHSDLKNKTFEEIQALYEKVKRFDESFTVVGSTEDERKIKEMNEEAKDLEQKRLKKKGIKKRKGGHMKMLARKRKRPQSDVDSDDELRKCLKIVTFEGTIDSEIMEKKSFISKLDKVSSPDGDYLVIYRANGNFRAFNYLLEVLHIFDRQDLFHLYNLMMEQYSEITLEGFELILWGDLKIMMESSKEENDQSDFWSDQQDWKIVTWRLYEACGVYILELEDGTVIHMLVERRYPLSKDLLQRMLDLGLEVERESTAALDLIRFIKQQIDEE
ncbi:putative ribonuclease H-like domain-containing protein [Tanacetum coccineum]